MHIQSTVQNFTLLFRFGSPFNLCEEYKLLAILYFMLSIFFHLIYTIKATGTYIICNSNIDIRNIVYLHFTKKAISFSEIHVSMNKDHTMRFW